MDWLKNLNDNSQDIYYLVWEWYQEPYLPLNGGMKGILAFLVAWATLEIENSQTNKQT